MRREELANIRVVALSGEEYQRSERMREILDAAVDPATKDFNFDTFPGDTFKSDTLPRFAELIVTFPMMAERRVIVLRNFEAVHVETRKKVAEVVKGTPDTSLVVIEGDEVKLTPKPAHLLAEYFKPIYESDLPSWINRRFAKRGRKIKPDAVALLINNVGSGLRDLDSEIEKVVTATGDDGAVTVEDVARFVGEFKKDTIWNLCNAIGLRNFDDATDITGRLLEAAKSNSESGLIASLGGHIMKIAEYNRQRASGVSHDEAMKTMTSSPFLWKLNKYDAQVRNYPDKSVRRALTILARADSSMKKYSQDKRLMMELLVPLLTRPRRAQGT